MKKNKILVFALLIILSSCTAYKISSYTSIKNTDDGRELVENNKEYISINYYGDYWFHPIRKNITLNWDDNFMNLIKVRKNKILYCGHTTIEPYYSTIGILYKSNDLTQLITDITEKLKKLKAQNLLQTNDTIRSITFTKLYYVLRDPELKIERRYCDYYCTHGNDVLRIVFWTSEYGHKGLENESENVIKTIKDI